MTISHNRRVFLTALFQKFHHHRQYQRQNYHRWSKLATALAVVASAPIVKVNNTALSNQQSDDHGDHVTEEQRNRTKAYAELALLFADRFSVDEKDREEKGFEISGYTARSDPEAVVWPISTDEVSSILRICNKYNVPVVAYGGGTSVEGHTSAIQGGLSVDLKFMDQIIQIHEEDEDVVVQSGIGWMELNEQLATKNFFVSADPGPGACLGGMCSTGCSGTNAVRYGTMKDQVINMTIVLADGTIFKTRQRPRKSSAGYDLARLFIGSEGTLGIITEVTLKLRSIPPVIDVAYVPFASIHCAAEAVIEILQNSIQVGAVEICDEPMISAMNRYAGLTLPDTEPILLFKFSGRSRIQVAEDVKAVAAICQKHQSGKFVWCDGPMSRDRLWDARKHAFWAAQAQRPDKRLMATDVAVPISRLAELITLTKLELGKSDVYGPIVGHVGDGNFHVCLMIDPEDPQEMEEARRLNRFMVYHALQMDGTCTGEHGIGVGKKRYLVDELGHDTVEVMRKIKHALDPSGILNPGKIFDFNRLHQKEEDKTTAQ